MFVDIIIGLQWGDEGKGKLVDLLTPEYQCVVRYQGGDNAGHTVVRDDQKFKFHLVPSGISNPGTLAVIGHGVVVNLQSLVTEIDTLLKQGITFENFRLSDRAFVVLPVHKREDAKREATSDAIGTTGRGIGPAYRDKVARTGIRIADFLEEDIRARLSNKELTAEEVDEQLTLFERVRPYVCDTVSLLHKTRKEGRNILMEGAQGVMLDIDFGTYPYVTSSSPTPGGGCLGTGLPPGCLNRVIGVMKAYTTRVGLGPFPTELTDALGDRLREKGLEFGTTTGRPRRCGWMDLPQLRYAAMICGVTELAIMKLDVLSDVETIRVGRTYAIDGKVLDGYPSRASMLEKVTVDYADLPGWREPIEGIRERSKLPRAAQDYLAFVERGVGVPIRYVSTSPDRDDTLKFDL